MKLSHREIALMHFVKQHQTQEIDEVHRRSEREFDLTVSGMKGSFRFSGWLPLLCIRMGPWTSPEFAMLSDYPDMVMQGDWSGIRDSSPDKVWRMFEKWRGHHFRD